jgi:triosephosphate isomerase
MIACMSCVDQIQQCVSFPTHSISSMTKKLVIGNWKMNPQTPEEAVGLVTQLERQHRDGARHCAAVVCPPFVFLSQLSKHLGHLKLGAQNVSWAESGSLTGEISAKELKEFGVQYVILGHSERRLFMGETDSVVNAKLIESLKHGLIPILCLGGEEGAIEGEMKTLCTKQFIKCTKDIEKSDLEKIVYVYEPIWAISTMKNSKPATGEHAADVIDHIYDLLQHRLGEKSQHVKVLYGGTVNKDNVAEYARHPQISGALVGAASLDADNFWAIVEEFERESSHHV